MSQFRFFLEIATSFNKSWLFVWHVSNTLLFHVGKYILVLEEFYHLAFQFSSLDAKVYFPKLWIVFLLGYNLFEVIVVFDMLLSFKLILAHVKYEHVDANLLAEIVIATVDVFAFNLCKSSLRSI